MARAAGVDPGHGQRASRIRRGRADNAGQSGGDRPGESRSRPKVIPRRPAFEGQRNGLRVMPSARQRWRRRSQPFTRGGRPLDFNSPTLFNVALNYRLNWRGNFRTLEQQNEFVLLNRRLMNTTWEDLLPKLRADQDYARSFSALYGRGPERAHVLDALATFQRSLLTPNARFDRYLNGQHDAITLRE